MTIHGYEIESEWSTCTCGEIAKARKNGKSYILKKYKGTVCPIDNGTLDRKTYDINKKRFIAFVDLRKRINAAIRSVTGPGGNIIIPEEEFVYENFLIEASEYIENAVPDYELCGVLDSLSFDTKKLLMQTAAGALCSIHSKHVIHSDLKPQNVLLVCNGRGNYVAKLIDFDGSYFVENTPEEVIGTIDYYSPELGEYGDSEDDRDDADIKLTEKSDIFSLGLLFHFYLTGHLPETTELSEKLLRMKERGRKVYCWVALNHGCKLQIDPSIRNVAMRALLGDMLKRNPSERPSASCVLKRLKEVSEYYYVEAWPEHKIVLHLEKMRADGVRVFSKVVSSGMQGYELEFFDGNKRILRVSELIEQDYAHCIGPESFCDAWDEHKLEFDIARIKDRGFVSSERATVSDIKGYNLYRSDSTRVFFRPETLLMMKYARNVADSVCDHFGYSDPWPEHRIEFELRSMYAKGYVSIKRSMLNGIKGYSLTDKEGLERFLRVDNMLIQGMAIKKGGV